MLSSARPCTNGGPSGAVADESSQGAENAPSVGFIHPDVVRAIHAVLVELGADLEGLVAEVGLDPHLFETSGKPVPFTAIGHLIALAADRLHCLHLGLLVGQRTTLASLGLLGLLLRNCTAVGGALRALEAHACVRDRGAVIGLAIYDDTAVLSYAQHEPEAKGAALHLERALATVTNILRGLCGPDWAPLEVLLPRSAPRDTAPYTGFFKGPVRFDQEAAALVLPAELLEQRIVGADPAVRRRVEENIRRLEADQPSTLTDKLREYLQTAVTRQRCTAEHVARMKLVDRRTLSRRLRAEGTNFRRLASEVQFQSAKQLLADTSMSLTQIADCLDFSELAGFTHAFRRWSGMTPSAWRRANRLETTRH
ncbi:AraC family transcriptional regulator [Methylobacterium oxalidis]|uniref:AraC family transcriptional regulator n=2 Tax=Methylobacterium oxalidis TaxID=944322 RepID=A0A512JBF8_9HYPH|nr:AraC family transcriptional regulator [Methylobacterium oxalidis]GJE33969.1 HTH-type transcriptional regulator VirS [Methylobacterium oxalidis]GLS63457.1 AraC family transcriptional regulator [Methylobacterium oxalidis]